MLAATPVIAGLIDAAAAALEPVISQTPPATEATLIPLTPLMARADELSQEPLVEITPTAPELVEPIPVTPPTQPPVLAELHLPAVEALPAPDEDMAVSYTHLDVYKRQGDLTVQASVTEDITGAIADSVNYAIEALRDLVSTINNTCLLYTSRCV